MIYEHAEIELYQSIMASAECAALDVGAILALNGGVLVNHCGKARGMWSASAGRLKMQGIAAGRIVRDVADAREALAAIIEMASVEDWSG